jgi:NAD(P)-dependent dehydrogenase (short-subunit alcohol dehydrogenase family)
MSTDTSPVPSAAHESTGRVWLITGASSGFGRAIAEAALAAGDTVIATARRPETLDDLVAAHPGRAVAAAMVAGNDGKQPGDPAKAAAAVLAALDAERTPLRLPLGGDAVDALRIHLDGVREELVAWEPVSRDTAFQD